MQRTPEWFEARCGKVTASRIADMLARTKSGWGAGRANYMAQLVAERLTRVVEESYVNAAMQHGIDTEAEARDAYAFYANADVVEVDFIKHPTIDMSGASPDGLVGVDGMLELKCPNTATHIDSLLGSEVPQKYLYQMQWQLACAHRKWCDFASYDPRMPESMRLHVTRIKRDDALVATLETEVRAFLAEVGDRVAALRMQYELTQAA